MTNPLDEILDISSHLPNHNRFTLRLPAGDAAY